MGWTGIAHGRPRNYPFRKPPMWAVDNNPSGAYSLLAYKPVATFQSDHGRPGWPPVAYMRFKMSLPMLTHKGWFGICPVYFGGLEIGCPLIVDRHWVFAPLYEISLAIFRAIGWVMSLTDPEFEMEFPLQVTGEIEPRDPPVLKD